MRVLQVVTDCDPRGAQVFAIDLQRGLEQLGHTVETVALAPGSHGNLLPLETLGPTRRAPSTMGSLRSRGADADIVVAHGSATLLACALAFAGTRTRFVYRQISDPLFWASTTFRRWRVAAMIRRAAAIVALSPCSSTVLQRHYRLSPDRITVIPNAVPAERFYVAGPAAKQVARTALGIPHDAIVVAAIGALVREKGVDVVLRSIRDIDNTVALIVGDGPERSDLEAIGTDLGLGRAKFLGAVDDTLEAYLAADIVMLPSRGGDSMPATLIEAGLCGLPAVATPIGSIEEVVLDGVTGIIVAADDIDGAEAATAALARDADWRARLGAAAASHCAAHFTIDATAPTWSVLLESHSGHR